MKIFIYFFLLFIYFFSLNSCREGSIGNSTFVPFREEEQTNLIIPLYKEDRYLWNKVISLDVDGIVVVINPNNGVGNKKSLFYENVILNLVLTNKLPVGYISTNYGKRDIKDIKREIDRWLTYYPQITGFFIDEVSGKSADLNYYDEIVSYIKLKGLIFNNDFITIFNVGSFPDFGYFNTADNIVVYEGNTDNLDVFACDSFPDKSSIIVYNASKSDMFDIVEKTNCKYIYITDDKPPNPYDSLPSYLDSELDALFTF